MSYKTERLVTLFPDVYAAEDTASLLYKLLDAIGRELMAADEAVKQLLQSHWVDYAAGLALDGLGAIFGVERRRLPDGRPETDEAFRLRLKSIVPLFTGGGTRLAILGAVRSALGLPFNLDQLNLPPQYAALRQDLENLVALVEFSPRPERLVSQIIDPAGAGELTLDVPILSVQAARPRLRWTFTRGAGRRLRLERLDAAVGVIADDALIIHQGSTLLLSAAADGALLAFVDETTNVGSHFRALNDGPALLPEVPKQPSQWRFTAEGGLFDSSVFDQGDTFDRPLFAVEMTWRSYEPLTFDVYVPYFLRAAVETLKAQHGYPGEIFVYEGLDLATIQAVVDQTRAAGVRGRVHFSLNFRTVHNQRERFTRAGEHRLLEEAGADEDFTVSSGARLEETHDASDLLHLGGFFDLARFSSGFGFH
jgi:hypothetical protein